MIPTGQELRCTRSVISLERVEDASFVCRILWKKNEVADYEATTFSIFYNNTLFLVLVVIASFFVLKNFNPTVYPCFQMCRELLGWVT